MSAHKVTWFRWVIFIMSLLVFSASCETAGIEREAPAPSKGDEIYFESIVQEAPLGDHPTDPTYLVITEPSQLEQLQGAIPDSALTAGNAFDGWDSSLIILVFSGVKGSSGYSIQIDSIITGDDSWTVTVTETGPDAEQIVEPAMTVPYSIVQVSKEVLLGDNPLLVEFIDQERKVLSTSEIPIH